MTMQTEACSEIFQFQKFAILMRDVYFKNIVTPFLFPPSRQ